MSFEDAWLEEDGWAEGLPERRDAVLKFLKKRGYEDYDIDALAAAETFDELPPADEPNELLELALGRAIDRRPPAEIIAAARWVIWADFCIKSMVDGHKHPEVVAQGAYMLGKIEVEFRVYANNPGQGSGGLSEPGALPVLFKVMDEYRKAAWYRRRNQKAGRQRQLRNKQTHLEKRNEALCETGRELRSQGDTDIHLAKNVWLNWERNDTWAEHPETIHFKSEKQVRKILHDGGVLPRK